MNKLNCTSSANQTGNHLSGQGQNQSHQQSNPHAQLNGLIKNQQANSNGQLPSLHELTGLTIKTTNQVSAALNCSPSSLSSNSTSPLVNQHLQSNLSTSNNSSSESNPSNSPSLARNSKDSKLGLTDCKSNVLNGKLHTHRLILWSVTIGH